MIDTSKRRATVCFIVQNDQILLALIEYNPTDKRWNGIGGWVEVGELPEDAVIREFGEETYIQINKVDLQKVVEFTSGNCLTVLITTKWSGELKIKEPSLKKLKWFSIDDLPYDAMFPGMKDIIQKIKLTLQNG